ncbi:hypothetical protein MUCCIDRAFT_155510 [Mucor lusitanicus CBS 277.49]|uniref:Uncharacterized protein n=1 Tax=Mucor lusitanicus CBS 277.49 TaxID=747725 RepID=A0A168P6W9_MUCCL|nr:hypothetical protein MUCCIDRAFT_155510 [Mucor lusitanicus CBS 277.49]
MVKILKIVKNLAKGKIKRDDADGLLTQMKSLSSDNERRILQAISDMVKRLPAISITEAFGELELTTGYLDPLSFPLLTGFDQNTKLVWPKLLQKEAKMSSSQLN